MLRGTSSIALSRRAFLQSIGVGALAVGAGARFGVAAVRAQGETMPMPSAFQRWMLGDLELTAIQEGVVQFPPTFFAVNAPEEELTALLEQKNLPTDLLNATITILLVRSGDRLTLIDTGLGPIQLDPNVPNTANRLLPTLELLGIAADDVTDVIVSHFHPDHIGTVSDGTTPTFANAMYYLPQAEQDFLASGPIGNADVDGLIELANGLLAPIAANDQLTFIEDEDEVVSGIQALATPGHTPGHMSFLLNSGGSQLLTTLDVVTHPVLSLEHPEWYMGFDAIPDLAVETRRAFLGRAADEGIQTLGYHFAFPGVGYVERNGDGFRFTAAM